MTMFLLKSLPVHKWLKSNNSLYADVNVNEHWVEESQLNDGDLFDSLVRRPETNNLDCATQDSIPQEGAKSDCRLYAM